MLVMEAAQDKVTLQLMTPWVSRDGLLITHKLSLRLPDALNALHPRK